jgi:hypothetical protein
MTPQWLLCVYQAIQAATYRQWIASASSAEGVDEAIATHHRVNATTLEVRQELGLRLCHPGGDAWRYGVT